jgi:response regulator RpfG family c-di-GMP phosphodiesterase
MSATPPGGLTNRVIGDGGPWRVLIVDDEETIRLALSKFLRTRGYAVQTAESGAVALDLLQRGKYVLMLCDVRMPGLSGVELVPRALSIDPELAIVMLTAVNDAPTAAEVLSAGAMDYLMKPIELTDLQQALERVLHRRGLSIEQRNVERLIREEVALRTAELEREKLALRALNIDIVEALINALEAKDIYLRGHSQRVAHLAAAIAQDLGLDEDTVEEIRLAGRLHDVGKIGIREAVLNKPGPPKSSTTSAPTSASESISSRRCASSGRQCCTFTTTTSIGTAAATRAGSPERIFRSAAAFSARRTRSMRSRPHAHTAAP